MLAQQLFRIRLGEALDGPPPREFGAALVVGRLGCFCAAAVIACCVATFTTWPVPGCWMRTGL
jgi:hypothetical protein